MEEESKRNEVGIDLEGVLAISGKPGLFKLVAQSRGGVIVESLADQKRFPVSQAGNVSALKDIAIYTYNEEVPLPEVYQKIAEKENFSKSLNPKSSKPAEWRAYLEEVLPEYDRDKVYDSDLKKLFAWYNLLCDYGYIAAPEAPSGSDEKSSSTEEE